MPTICNDFVDRLSEIEKLRSTQSYEGFDKNSFVVVFGQKGLGKTQLLARYLRECNNENVSIAYVDLPNKDYLGLIDEIIEGIGGEGFETIDEVIDDLIRRFQVETAENTLRNSLEIPGRDIQAQNLASAITFNQPVQAENQIFISGPTTFNNPKFTIINTLQLTDTTSVRDAFEKRITLEFHDCLRTKSKECPITILLDHWEGANDPLKIWLGEHLIRWSTEFKLKRGLVIIAQESVDEKYKNQIGILPLELKPFDRKTALDCWLKNGLAEESFTSVGIEIYSTPKILATEIDKQRILKDKPWITQSLLTPTR
jgi:hypothetical protein